MGQHETLELSIEESKKYLDKPVLRHSLTRVFAARKYELCTRKLVYGNCGQVRLNPVCSVTETKKNFAFNIFSYGPPIEKGLTWL